MEPGIGRSLKQGVLTASRSWAGIGFFAAIWLVVVGIAVGCIAATNPPPALFQSPAVAAPAAQAPGTSATAAADVERTRELDAWFGRAWPLLLVCLLLFFSVNVWLNAGQVGYLAQRVATGRATVSEFAAAGSRAFGALLAASFLMMLGVGAPFALFWILSVALPSGGRVIMLLLGVIAVAALVWVGVRLFFFSIAIVAERLGPVAGFKASFRLTRGHWWKIFALAVLLGVLSYAALLPFTFLEWLGGVLGGPAALVLGLLGNLGTILASLFMGFASLAAFIQCYHDLKSSPSSA